MSVPTSEAMAPAPTPITAAEERTGMMLAHLSGLLAFAGPLVVLLVYKDRSLAVAREAKESLNFQITIALAFVVLMIVGSALTFVVVGVLLLIAAPLLPLAAAVLSIVAAVRANGGRSYRYPATIRMVR